MATKRAYKFRDTMQMHIPPETFADFDSALSDYARQAIHVIMALGPSNRQETVWAEEIISACGFSKATAEDAINELKEFEYIVSDFLECTNGNGSVLNEGRWLCTYPPVCVPWPSSRVNALYQCASQPVRQSAGYSTKQIISSMAYLGMLDNYHRNDNNLFLALNEISECLEKSEGVEFFAYGSLLDCPAPHFSENTAPSVLILITNMRLFIVREPQSQSAQQMHIFAIEEISRTNLLTLTNYTSSERSAPIVCVNYVAEDAVQNSVLVGLNPSPTSGQRLRVYLDKYLE